MPATIDERAAESQGFDDTLYEIVEGGRLEPAAAGVREALIWTLVCSRLGTFSRARGYGRVIHQALFAMDGSAATWRRPDVSFVSYDRWPKDRRIEPTDAWAVVPDLAVEVVSPGNFANEIPERVAEYFSAGVRRVWVVYPTVRLVYVYESSRRVRVVGPGEEVEGGDVVPGFRLAVDELFEDLGDDNAEPATD